MNCVKITFLFFLCLPIIGIAQNETRKNLTPEVKLSADPVFDYLVWSDEFDGGGAINPNNWFHQTRLLLGDRWANGEIQHYTNRPDNSSVKDGTLRIVAQKESYTDQGITKEYTSARLNSKFAFRYGRVEVRAKLPTGVGTWPAIWMLGKNIDENGGYWDGQGFGTTPWPACGEIDIMEHWGDNQNYVQSAMHTTSSSGATFNYGGQTIPTASTEFHVYTLEWTAEKMVFSVDDVVHYTYDPTVKNAATWPFDAEQYILLNVAILPEIDPSFTNSTLEIDYVRVYQESPVSTRSEFSDVRVQAFPNPFVNELIIQAGNASSQNTPVFIYNSEGKVMQTFEVDVMDGQFRLPNLDHLHPGLYTISYMIDDRPHAVQVVKE